MLWRWSRWFLLFLLLPLFLFPIKLFYWIDTPGQHLTDQLRIGLWLYSLLFVFFGHRKVSSVI